VQGFGEREVSGLELNHSRALEPPRATKDFVVQGPLRELEQELVSFQAEVFQNQGRAPSLQAFPDYGVEGNNSITELVYDGGHVHRELLILKIGHVFGVAEAHDVVGAGDANGV